MRKRTVFRLAAGTVRAGAATLAYASLVERNLFTLRRFDVPVLAAGRRAAARAAPVRPAHDARPARASRQWVADAGRHSTRTWWW